MTTKPNITREVPVVTEPAAQKSAAMPLPPKSGGLWTRLTRGRTRAYAASDWPSFAGADWLASIMSVVVTDRLHEKQGRSIARWSLTSADGRELTVYLKRHFILPRRHGWLAALLPGQAWSPGWEEWRNLRWAADVGLPVPRVLAAGEILDRGGRLQSFLAVEELAGMIGLHEAVPLAYQRLPAEVFACWKRGLIVELARLCRDLHRRRAFHKDLYFCHFYIAEADTAVVPEDWRGRVVMIDFHRLARHRLGWQWFLVKDLAQFLYSSEVPGVTARDRLRFWKYYQGGDWSPTRPPGQRFRNLVQRKWRLYKRHNEKRKATSRPSAPA